MKNEKNIEKKIKENNEMIYYLENDSCSSCLEFKKYGDEFCFDCQTYNNINELCEENKELIEREILYYESSLYDLYNENCKHCEHYNNTMKIDCCDSCFVSGDRDIIIKILSKLREKI